VSIYFLEETKLDFFFVLYIHCGLFYLTRRFLICSINKGQCKCENNIKYAANAKTILNNKYLVAFK
jgi:hypothetical protein